MSADNWARCPRCVADLEKTKADARQHLDDQYGKVDREAYKALERQVAEVHEIKPTYTFREDYEVTGADTGVVKVSYYGKCQTCGLVAELQHEVRFFEPPAVTS